VREGKVIITLTVAIVKVILVVITSIILVLLFYSLAL